MRKALFIALAAAGIAGAATVQQATAQPPRPAAGSPEAAGFVQLFVSPAGEPYRARVGEAYPSALWFKQADLNHDGVITREEFREDHAGFFSAIDYDDAGVIDGTKIAFYERKVLPDVYLAQISAAAPRRAPGRADIALAAYDPQADGARLIRVQLINQAGPNIVGGNANPDYKNTYSIPGANGPMEGLGARRPEKRQLIGAAYYGLLGEAEPIRAADTDLDGRVTKAEFLAAADRRFKQLDKRHDGKLTLDELPLTPAQIDLEKRGVSAMRATR